MLTDQSGSISINRERSGCRYLIQQPEGWIIIVDMTSFNSFNQKFINVCFNKLTNLIKYEINWSQVNYFLEVTPNFTSTVPNLSHIYAGRLFHIISLNTDL